MAIGLAREGQDRKACAALLSAGLCPHTAETAQALRGLHPPHAPPVARALHDLLLAPEVVPDAVAKALRSFPAGTARGPSGLRVQHLREASHCWRSRWSLPALGFRGWASCTGPGLLSGCSCLCRCQPHRLAQTQGRCSPTCNWRNHFWPAQVGVAFSSGVEAAVRHVHPADHVLLKLDFKKSRQAVLDVVQAHFPALARWTTWC